MLQLQLAPPRPIQLQADAASAMACLVAAIPSLQGRQMRGLTNKCLTIMSHTFSDEPLQGGSGGGPPCTDRQHLAPHSMLECSGDPTLRCAYCAGDSTAHIAATSAAAKKYCAGLCGSLFEQPRGKICIVRRRQHCPHCCLHLQKRKMEVNAVI